MNYSQDKAAPAPFVGKLLIQMDGRLPSITVISPDGSEASCAVTAITESSGSTRTAIYFDGLLHI